MSDLAAEAQWLLTAFDPDWVEDSRLLAQGDLQRWMQDAQGWAVSALRTFEDDEAGDSPLRQAAQEVFAATSTDAPLSARDALQRALGPASS